MQINVSVPHMQYVICKVIGVKQYSLNADTVNNFFLILLMVKSYSSLFWGNMTTRVQALGLHPAFAQPLLGSAPADPRVLVLRNKRVEKVVLMWYKDDSLKITRDYFPQTFFSFFFYQKKASLASYFIPIKDRNKLCVRNNPHLFFPASSENAVSPQ